MFQTTEGAQAGAYQFKLKEFEGPLDLLLFLIRKNEVSVYDIPIAQITDQYLSYLQFAAELDLDSLSEFRLMAATLLLLKSRMLLPIGMEGEEDVEDPREELVEKLIEYQKFKKLSELMEEKERELEWSIERKNMQRALPFDEEDVWQKADVWELLRSFSRLMNNITGERIINLYEEVSINEKITLINEFLDTRGEFNFTDLLIHRGSIMDIVCSFLAVLEAVKLKVIAIYQNRIFGDIMIRKPEPVAVAEVDVERQMEVAS